MAILIPLAGVVCISVGVGILLATGVMWLADGIHDNKIWD